MSASSKSPTELKLLTEKTVKVSDLAQFPRMTGWFGPVLLSKLLLRVIVSDVFGQYADRRLMQAALDQSSLADQLSRAKKLKVARDDQGAAWVDYVSDLGDGFDATYAIAYQLAQPELTIDGKKLPRGGLLVMGGDEVYPTARRDDYIVKMQRPYQFALPDSADAEISLLLLPGNHDWYDGLVNFLAIFCRERTTKIGGWRTVQRRSYFAAEITKNWWIWGIDIALVRDMDQPQADYFVGIAKGMPEGSNIILCSAEPGWYKADANGDAYRTLSYAAWIAENAKKDLKVPLVLSGDSHHYARYAGSGAQYITSGGGGAFLHGTLELKHAIKAEWLREKEATLALQACYPSKDKSSELLTHNRRFGQLNPELTWTLGVLYLLCSFVLTSALLTSVWRWDVGVVLFAMLFAGLYLYGWYQEGASRKLFLLSGAHAIAHMAVIVALAGLALWLNARLFSSRDWHWFLWLGLLAIPSLTIGRWLAGKIFGWNLLLTCRHFGMNHNDAFSAIKLDSHRHFLRFRIVDNELTIFPIKLETVPTREQWRENPRRGAPSASIFVSEPPMNPQFIEDPIVIQAEHAPSTAEVKAPSELPSPG